MGILQSRYGAITRGSKSLISIIGDSGFSKRRLAPSTSIPALTILNKDSIHQWTLKR